EILAAHADFLAVFIDGINESRRLPEYNEAMIRLLEWSKSHRIKIVTSCRDIYWEFFNYSRWEANVSDLFRNELNRFSQEEYSSALPLYLDYYNISCQLAEAASQACKHPLLLRFFCEAYGSING